LFATAMGLAVAIPAVVAYNHFIVQLGRLAARMNAFIGRAGALLSRVSE
jgi:biopolymer transport protein TolQ